MFIFFDTEPSRQEWDIATAARSSECAAIAKVFRRSGWAIVVLGLIGFGGAAWFVGELDADSEVPPIFIWMWPSMVLVSGVTMIVLNRYLQYRSERYAEGVVTHIGTDPSREKRAIETIARESECADLAQAFERWGMFFTILGAIGAVFALLITGPGSQKPNVDIPALVILAIPWPIIIAGVTMAVLRSYLGFRSWLHGDRVSHATAVRLKRFKAKAPPVRRNPDGI